MSRPRTYSDDALVEAVAASRSWRGVLRELGLAATSSSAMRSVRAHVDRLGLDHSHFTGRRRWTYEQLADAVRSATTWAEVTGRLGLADASSPATVKGHARRLGLDTTHLEVPKPVRPEPAAMTLDVTHLRRAGSLIAAAWFTLCGYEVSWPLEPCRYDLLVGMGGNLQRVQVKTTTVRAGRSWTVWLSTTGTERAPYDPDEIDWFFVVDGNLAAYLIPVAAVGGYHAINLAAYQEFRVLTKWGAASRRTGP